MLPLVHDVTILDVIKKANNSLVFYGCSMDVVHVYVRSNILFLRYLLCFFLHGRYLLCACKTLTKHPLNLYL